MNMAGMVNAVVGAEDTGTMTPLSTTEGRSQQTSSMYASERRAFLRRRPFLKKLLVLLSRPDEIGPLFQMALAARAAKKLPQEPNLAFCYDMLNRVSRR